LELPVGRHDLEIRYVGYDNLGEPIMIVEGEQRMLDASLDPSALALDEVVVSSEKAGRAKDRKRFSKEAKLKEEVSSRAPASAEPAYTEGAALFQSDDAEVLPDDSYARGYQAMQQQDSVTAFKWMQETLQERPSHPEAALYSGLILLQSQRPADALSYLEPLIARNPGEEIVAEARWYQALSYVALRNREAAEPILLSIKEKGGEYSRDASLTLEELGW
jgi:tetratricopeptide (TPR) repeat protein